MSDALQVVASVELPDRENVLKASGLDGVFTRPFINADSEKNEFKMAPFPVDITLETARRKAAFFGDRAYGVVTNAKGFALRVKCDGFEEALKQVNPTAVDRFSGERWEVSGLPLSMGEQGVVLFLDGWKVKPVHSFRQGSRRTWVVRADSAPFSNIFQHADGIVLAKKAERAAPANVAKERWQPAKTSSRSQQGATVPTPMSWAQAVAPIAKAAAPVAPSMRSSPHTEVKEKPKEENVMSLQETIAATIAAAMVPFQQQLDRLKTDMQVMQSLQSPMLVDEGQGEKRGASTAETRPSLRLRVT